MQSVQTNRVHPAFAAQDRKWEYGHTAFGHAMIKLEGFCMFAVRLVIAKVTDVQALEICNLLLRYQFLQNVTTDEAKVLLTSFKKSPTEEGREALLKRLNLNLTLSPALIESAKARIDLQDSLRDELRNV